MLFSLANKKKSEAFLYKKWTGALFLMASILLFSQSSWATDATLVVTVNYSSNIPIAANNYKSGEQENYFCMDSRSKHDLAPSKSGQFKLITGSSEDCDNNPSTITYKFTPEDTSYCPIIIQFYAKDYQEKMYVTKTENLKTTPACKKGAAASLTGSGKYKNGSISLSIRY